MNSRDPFPDEELLPGRTMVGHTAYPIVIAKGSVI